MLSMHDDSLSQRLIYKNIRSLILCAITFFILSNCKTLLAQSPSENTDSMSKEMASDEFKALVENIYELLLHEHSTDDIIEMLDCDQMIPYNIKKLVTHIQDLLDKQNSKCNIINIVVNNNESEEYRARTNFLSLLTNTTTYYFALKIIAVIFAFIVTCYLLSPYLLGDSGFLKGKPKPKNQCNAKDVIEKSNDRELPYPNVPNHDDALQPDERQEEHGQEIPGQAAQETRPEAAQSNQQRPLEPQQTDVLVSDKAAPEIVQRQQASLIISVKNTSVDYELMEEVQQRVASAISLCANFAEPLRVDMAVNGNFVNEPIDTRKLSEIIEERIGECEQLMNSKYIRIK